MIDAGKLIQAAMDDWHRHLQLRGVAIEGRFQVCIIPVDRKRGQTIWRRTYYLLREGRWCRTTQQRFMAEVAKENTATSSMEVL